MNRCLPRCPKKRAAVVVSGAGVFSALPLAVLFLVSDPLSAGDSASAQGDVQLRMIDDVSVSEQSPMRFPQVVQGEGDSIVDEQPAEFRVDGAADEDVTVSVDESLQLEGPGGTIPVELSIAGGGTSVSANLQFGSLNVPVNGTIPAGGVPDTPGTYNGTFTVTVDYQ